METFAKVESAITTLRNKFLESPFTFYTESAMHCYLYHLLYQGETFKRQVKVTAGGTQVETILIQKEYPTLGKFYKHPKSRVLMPCEDQYVEVDGKRLKPSRGAYDLAIIDPDEATDFKRQKTKMAIELALNEVHPSLWHLRDDYTKITYEKDKVFRGWQRKIKVVNEVGELVFGKCLQRFSKEIGLRDSYRMSEEIVRLVSKYNP